MTVDFRSADYYALADLWRGFYPAKYHVSSDLIRRKTVECPLFDWGSSAIAVEDGKPVAWISVKRSPSPSLFREGDPDVYHLSAIAYKSSSAACDLLAQAKMLLRDRGVPNVVFGMDSEHFFPGCPEDVPMLGEFLTIQGFASEGGCVDLERDMQDYVPPAGCLEKLQGKGEVRPLKPGEEPLISEFINAEFPGRWHYDVMHQLELEGRPELVDALFVDGKIEGFAFTQDWMCRYPVNGGVWYMDLGESWGALGPIGVSKAVRGLGLGGAVLGSSLQRMRGRGVRRMIIDWTGLVEFYGKHGFEVTRRYTGYKLDLATSV